MTEQEWLESDDAGTMLDFVQTRTTARKLRLVANACLLRISFLLVPEGQALARRVIELAEGTMPSEERKRLRERAFHLHWVAHSAHQRGNAKQCLVAALARRPIDAAFGAVGLARNIGVLRFDYPKEAYEMDARYGLLRLVDWSTGRKDQSAAFARLVREIIGNPFRTITVDPRWRWPGLEQFCQSLYEGHGMDQMPKLGKGLEYLGCTESSILEHCRQTERHPPGCWVLDLLLGKQ